MDTTLLEQFNKLKHTIRLVQGKISTCPEDVIIREENNGTSKQIAMQKKTKNCVYLC